MRLKNLVKIDNRFEKSVNLLLDLKDEKKVGMYIPTRSSVDILKRYLKEVDSYSGERATILIGPYGKGKSHLLLVLMSILNNSNVKEIADLVKRIRKIDPETADLVKKLSGEKKLLPVIVSAGNGNLNHILIKSLNQSLTREGLDDIVPSNYFTEAVKIIEKWKALYPDTLRAFEEKISTSVEEMLTSLGEFKEETLNEFKVTYPLVTSGSEFNPMVDDEMITVFQSINKSICEKYDYKGIYVVFDEFSKYIEGHVKEGFAADMNTLQNLCNLCDSSNKEQIYLTCVAHKSIKAYGTAIPAEVLNAFKGVEGRLKEVRFLISSQNNYELIADAITKTKEFDEYKKNNEAYNTMLADSHRLSEFSALFKGYDDFVKIVGDGCFPLTPLASLLLLNLSEKIAQNERTLFTYIASKEPNGLCGIIDKEEADFIGADKIYDYFVPLFEDERDIVHNEWLKAEYAIANADNDDEIAIIKTLAIIRMINMPSTLPANDNITKLACGISAERFETAIEALAKKEIVGYKKREHAYDFLNGVDVDVEKIISEYITKYCSKIDISEVINKVNRNRFITPKKYNQEYQMTRFFGVHFIKAESFVAMNSSKYIEWDNTPDGIVFCVLPDANIAKSTIAEHSMLMDDTTVVILPKDKVDTFDDKAKTIVAIERLLSDKEFINENGVIAQDLENIKTSIINEINEIIRDNYLNEKTVLTKDGKHKTGTLGLNRFISDICETVYCETPIINNESINKNNISAQISKARNTLLNDIFYGRDFKDYAKGTSPEATIYRAVFLGTQDDENLENVRRIIREFIHESKGVKNCFKKLIDTLTSAPIGMRKGVIPFFLMDELVKLEDMPVIYLNNKNEMTINSGIMSNVMARPGDYSLYVEEENGQKLEYIEGLEGAFSEYGSLCKDIDARNRLSKVTCLIQSWFRSLPQTSTAFTVQDNDNQEIKKIVAFRKIFAEATVNPREILFDRLPHICKGESFAENLECIISIKKAIDNHLLVEKDKAIEITREVLGMSKKADFVQCLKEWYGDIPDEIKNSAVSSSTRSVMTLTKELGTSDKYDTVNKLSKIVLGLYVEDWKDSSSDVYKNGLEAVCKEIESKKGRKLNTEGSMIITNGSGDQLCVSNFNPDDISVSGTFLKNMLDDAVSEYGDSVGNEEKIGILMEMIKELMK